MTEIDRERNKGALRRGYTTGTCAAAAAQAAAWMLLAGTRVEKAAVTLPGGMRLELAVEEERSGAGWASCAVRKDSGDDPDVTDGLLVWATVSASPIKTEKSGIIEHKEEYISLYLSGVVGVVTVTWPGLCCNVG